MDNEPTRKPDHGPEGQPTPDGQPTMPAGRVGPPTEPLAYSYAAAPPPGRFGERRKTWVRVGVAGGIAALGLTAGGIAVATADDESGRPGGGFGRFVGGGLLGDDLAERLAEELGVDQDKVEDALDDVREEYGPEVRERFRDRLEDGELPSPPTEAEIEERQDAFAAALAEALDLDKADVEAALEEINADFQARIEEHLAEAREAARSDLIERLDAAVEDGTLTQADKESVLKAYDEGVIGGPGGHLVHGGPFDFGAPFGGTLERSDEGSSTNS
jgi:AcrR family transcriptional regulator